MKNGLQSYRDWLVYSPQNDRIYCSSCWLFANRSDKHFDPAFSEPDHGFNKWRKATDKISGHEQSSIHLESLRQLVTTSTRLKLGMAINQEQIRAYEEQIIHNRKVLYRLLDISLFLARQNLAFRGHRETRFSCLGKASDKNEGNFLELVRLIAEYDSVLAKHIASAGRNQLYLSPNIQNDFISALADEVKNTILNEIKNAHFYGIILDSTIDISHKDQFSFCVRYVDDKFLIQERFLQFTDLKGVKASESANLFQELEQLLQKNDLDIKWIRSQSYDGASNMSGHISGLQMRVKEVNPYATYVHCCAHNLNLVLAHSCDNCVQAVTFFGTVQTLYTFITSSLPRLTIFEEAQAELHMPKVALKKLCETRWYCKHSAVKAVKENYAALLLALEKIIKREKSPKHVGEAQGLLNSINKFEFLLMLEIWIPILSELNSVSEYLQMKWMDIVTASAMVTSVIDKIAKARSEDHFKECVDAATEVATEEDLPHNSFTPKRIRKRKKMPGELASDEAPTDLQERFKTEVYNTIYDRILTEMRDRFEDLRVIVKDFACLMPSTYFGKISMFRDLVASYHNDVDVDIAVAEYEQFCILYNQINPKKPDGVIDTLQGILHWYYEHDLQNAYPNLAILYRIFGTIAVSSASAERSFSKLKIIKNYLRSTMGEERLAGLTLLSIEREMTEKLDFENVIDRFSRMAKRNMLL